MTLGNLIVGYPAGDRIRSPSSGNTRCWSCCYTQGMVLSPGASLGPYRIVGHLGEGGMGEVYRATDTRLARDVAIKVLPQHLCHNPVALQRFQREAKALAALSHPNIVTIYDIGEHDRVKFVVMEMLEGQTLRQRIQQATPTLAEAMEIIISITQGLAAAHLSGIIHRDLKPENILITRDERVKILDFGLAKRFDSKDLQDQTLIETQTQATEEGTILGTVPYMSPEQARGEILDARSDIFSAGTIFYELLTGRSPFQASTIPNIIHKIVYEEPLPVSTLRPSLPKCVDTLLEHTLAKQKESRYSSAAEMLTDLKRYRDSWHSQGLEAFPMRMIFSRIRAPRIVIPTVIVILALCFFAIWFISRQTEIRWAKEEALAEIERLVADNWGTSLTAAYRVALKAEKIIPNDPKLAELFSKCSVKINIRTEPAGAKVYLKEYRSPESEWQYLGLSPIAKIRVPAGLFRWKLEKEGYQTVLAASSTYRLDLGKKDLLVASDLVRTLDEQKGIQPGMARVPGEETPSGKLDDFYMDVHEVTNRQYKNFIDVGGYRERKYWKHAFINDGRLLSWEEAMAKFVDQTNRAGPSIWQAGEYIEEQDDYPVSGISWFEAAAYAEFVKKSLPTSEHWGIAAGEHTPMIRWGFASLALFSNFGSKGPIPVGSLSGITAYGIHDMAGNVREWCWNKTPNGRSIRGGAWNDISYMFGNLSQAPPMDRSSKNGLRCALYPDPWKIPESAFAAIELPKARNYYKEKPVSDSIYQVYKEQFSYDKTDLNAHIEFREESTEGWIQEKITLDAAYGAERMVAYLFIPRNATPPYQTIIYFPGSASVYQRSSEHLEHFLEYTLYLSFIVKNGHAVLYPVYKGTFERGTDALTRIHVGDGSHQFTEFMIQLVKDFRRCLDYLETRQDIDKNKLAYYGFSWGAWGAGMIIPAVEERLKANIWLSGGLEPGFMRPEVDGINYITRVKIPTLILNGRYDTVNPYETTVKPMFDLLGTSKEHKTLKLYDTDHVPPRSEIVKEILAWLDRYLGPVNR